MDLQITRYIHVRHWDYWYDVHHISGQTPNSVEICITDDMEGNQPFFHLDLCNTSGMERLLEQDEYIDKKDPSYPSFCKRLDALRRGETPFLIGALFFQHYIPPVDICNRPIDEGTSLFDLCSPSMPPYYADIFLHEARPLTPDVLQEWVEKLAPILFHQNFSCKVVDMPSYEESLRAYREDRPV